jgi:hypothetical protein
MSKGSLNKIGEDHRSVLLDKIAFAVSQLTYLKNDLSRAAATLCVVSKDKSVSI